jgi:hypothetical protein
MKSQVDHCAGENGLDRSVARQDIFVRVPVRFKIMLERAARLMIVKGKRSECIVPASSMRIGQSGAGWRLTRRCMSIDFDEYRWKTVRAIYHQWWQGELDRPVVPLVLRDRRPTRPEPDTPLLTQATCTDLTIHADSIIDRIDYELSQLSYLGDSFPYFNMDCFGPGVIAAFLGARLDNSTGRVWFHADVDRNIGDIHFRFDPDNMWFRRIGDIYAAGFRRWEGNVLMGMTDIGGNLDILSTFRPGEKLLLDLYDHPDEVTRLTWEAHEAWHHYYNALNSLLQADIHGYSDWTGIYSDRPSYVLQCDFCYMIGPAMFDAFVKPELAATCGKLPNTIYHLDGVGQLPHVDSVLAIPALKGVQWVPGAGKPDCSQWPEVYRKIRDGGKLVQLIGDFEVLDAVRAQLGSARGIHLKNASARDRQSGLRKLKKYGID